MATYSMCIERGMEEQTTEEKEYIKARGQEKTSNLIIHKATDNNILRSIETAIDLGKWVLIENVTEKIDPMLENLLQLGRMKSGAWVKLGARQVKYDDQFRFYPSAASAVFATNSISTLPETNDTEEIRLD